MSSLTVPSAAHHLPRRGHNTLAALATLVAIALAAILISSAWGTTQPASLARRADHGTGARIGYVYSPLSHTRALACIAGTRAV